MITGPGQQIAPAVRRLRWHAGAREPCRQPVRSGRAARSGRMRALGSQHWPYAELDPCSSMWRLRTHLDARPLDPTQPSDRHRKRRVQDLAVRYRRAVGHARPPPPAGLAPPRAAPTFVAAVAQPPETFPGSPGRCSACHAPAVTAPPAGVAGSRRPSDVCYRQVRRVLPGRLGGGRPGPFPRLASCAAMPGRTR